MDELTTTENLYQLWMIYSSKNELEKLKEFIKFFTESYKDLVDFDFEHLNEGFSDEGPHLTKLPDGILQVFGSQLANCSESFQHGYEAEHIDFVNSILQCLIVICRNYDNVPLVASCEFVKYIVNITTTIVEKIASCPPDTPNRDILLVVVKLTIHFFECLYDPYFIWRKRLKGWTVDKSRLQYRPAALHVELVPFFYECCEKDTLPLDLHIRLLNMFGSVLCGDQYNALRAITPATLDILLKLLSINQIQGPTNEQRQELYFLKDLVLKCIIRMVHVIHSSSPDQRQIEVSHVMEGYMQVLLEKDLEPEDEAENYMQLSMISAINEMLECHDKGALQVILVSGGTFDAFVSLLQKTALTGTEAQRLAMSVLRVINTVLSGSCNAKERFHLRVGYGKFVEALKCLGQPSQELLGAVLNLVVESTFDPSKSQCVHNTQAAIMLLHWLPDIQSHDLQIWLSENLSTLCCKGPNNKMNCCNGGMISAILSVLGREKQVNSKAVGYLIALLESLGTQSITAIELKQLIGLLRLDEEEKQNPYCTRLMRAISTMARREGKEGALYFFNLQEPADSIMLPSIRKWPGSAFSFHTWLCVDCDTNNTSDTPLYRRQLYSFVTGSGCGFESFLTPDCEIVIAVYNRKEYSTVIVTETSLSDLQWHCLDIVHSSSKRPFSNSQLNVYIDGKLKFNSQFKFPNITEPFVSCRVAGPCPRSTVQSGTDQQHPPDTKKKSRLHMLFQSQSKASDPGVSSITGGTQDEVWGSAVTLGGQLGSVCIFHDALSPAQIKCLYSAGPNNPSLFSDDSYGSEFNSKSLLYYNAKACKDNHCVDLSPNQNHGQLIGQCCVTWDVKDVINCIGGIQVLFPLLEQVDKAPLPKPEPEPEIQKLIQNRAGVDQDDWVVIPSSSYADSKLEQNHVAGFLTLLRHILQTRVANRDTFTRTNGAATIGALLQKVNPKMIDVNVLMAVQLLVESMASVDSTAMMNHLYQYILFDFRIWSSSDFPVRIGHIQYLSTLIKEDRKYFRKKFGVQYILDVIRMYYSNHGNGSGLSEEDAKTIRVSLLSVIKFYIIKDIHIEEIKSIIDFTLVAKKENLICEALDIVITMLDVKRKQDQLHLFMFEQDMAELFYGLLTVPDYSVVYYEKIVKVLYILLKTDKVYEKNKARLRLADAGHLGLVGMMQGCDVSGPMIKRFMEQVAFTDTLQSYNSVLAVLQLIYYCGSDIKLEASRQILNILVTKTSAAKHFAKQLGWQEAIVKLLISRPLDDQPINTPNSVAMETVHEADEEYSCDSSDNTPVKLRKKKTENGTRNGVMERPENIEIKNGTEDRKERTSSVPSKLSLSPVNKDNSSMSSPKTPLTPFYLTSKIFDDLNSSEDERSRSMSRSSSASVEDLSSVSQRSMERHSSVISNSSSSISISDSAIDLNTSTNSLGDSRRSSAVQAENIQRALDSLGIQNVYVKDNIHNNVERIEELSQNLLIILLTIMWKGIEGSDKAAWMERGQVFSWIDKIAESNELIRPAIEVKRRLLEMMLHSCTSDIRDLGQAAVLPTENALELVRLIRDFLHDDEVIPEKFSERLIEDTMTMLDMLAVWDVESDGGWKEMARLGLNLLISYARHPHIELCAVSTAKLHTLVQTKLISSSAEASYLLGNLSILILKAVQNNTDNYSFLIPVLKALMDKASALLNLDIHLPNLPPTSRSPTFFDDFKNYCVTEEWTVFVENYVNPQMFHFVEHAYGDTELKVKEFWDSCNEAIMVNMHKRNRERGDSKLKFQSQILDVFKARSTHEQKRFQNISTQLCNQHSSALRMWRATKRFFTGERGAWAERKPNQVHWKLSNQENFSRMKVKLVQNYNYDDHAEASFQRDNLGLTETDATDQLQQLVAAKEALVSKKDLADDSIGDEDWSVISAQGSEEMNDKEKLVLSEECELVTLVDVIKGRLEVTTTHVYFFDCSQNKEEGGEDFKWALSQLREIHFRRYNLRRSALEMFLVDQTNYFLNFQQKLRNKVYSRILSLHPPNVIYYGSRSPAELLKTSGLTQKWVQRDISNFDYLIQLNTIAGRTYNDLSQYPVFPWILCDYESETLNLEDENIYRDLAKPIGAVNPKNEREVREKFDTFEDPSGVIEKFHYGTHYSNAAGVMHYMVRLEPFTTLHIHLQSGRFDVADRQFHSLPGTWKMLMENPNDVKELVPEFFYLPEFLINMNEFDLGKLQISKETINDVILPKWADSPEDFINKHRKALESDFVSSKLHNWIDLIFGYKQKGPAAEEALNVFYYCTYEGAVDLDAVKDLRERKALEGMINNFGQTPCQLLKDPHPKRLTFDEVVAKSVKLDKPLNVFHFLNQLKVFFVEVSQDTDPLGFISVPRSQTHSIIQHGMPDTMVTVSEGGIIGLHGWLPYEKYVANYFTFEKDPSLSSPRTKRKPLGPFAPGLKVDSKLFVVSHDAKLLFSGGHWDNSLQVFNLGKNKLVNHIVRHIDIVTCLALDYCGNHLITGSRDTSCIIWQIQQQGGFSVNINNKPLQILYGHDAEVTAVSISTELDMSVSAAKDGTIIVHTVRRGHYMRTLRPEYTMGYNLSIPYIALDEFGHIILYCHETFPIDPKEKFFLHVYSVNGKFLFRERLQCGISDMLVSGDYLIAGDNQGQLTVWEIFGLKNLTALPLHVPVHSLSVTNNNSHILAGLRDGKLIIVGVKNK